MGHSKKSKKPSHEPSKESTKSSVIEGYPVFRFDKIDKNGEFAFDTSRDDFKHRKVLDKIMEYSCMTWNEITKQTHDKGKSKHHYIGDGLSKEAETRMTAMELDDLSDDVFSFSLENRLRIVGIRIDDDFHVLWYDPEHKVCISHKKHT